MVTDCVRMSLPRLIIELLEWVYQRHSSSLYVKNDESFQKRQTHQFSVISMVVMNSLNQILEYLILQVPIFSGKIFDIFFMRKRIASMFCEVS